MATNLDIITTIYCTQLESDQCGDPEADQPEPSSIESGRLSREFLSIYKERVLLFPFD